MCDQKKKSKQKSHAPCARSNDNGSVYEAEKDSANSEKEPADHSLAVLQ